MELARAVALRAGQGVQPEAAGVGAKAAGSLAGNARLSLVTTPAGLHGLEASWRHLEAEAQAPSVFQSYDWIRSWADTYLGLPDAPKPVLIAGERDGRLAFVWPLMRTRRGPVRLLRWLSEPHAQYGDVLLARDEPAEPWLTAALDLIHQIGDVDAIRLRHVRRDAQAADFLAGHFRNAHSPDTAPWMDLSSFADESAYEARYTPTQRKRRKKIRRSLEEALGPLAFQLVEDPGACREAIAAAIAEKARWIEARGRHNRVFGCPRLAAFLLRLPQAGPVPLRLVTSCLTAGGRPISWEIGLRFGGTHFAFITAHDNRLTAYSPARLHMDLSQRQALRDGLRDFDLMVPHDPHKDSWSSGAVATADYYLPLSPLGRIYGRLYLEALRPALRAVYHRLPDHALRSLKPIIRH